MKIILLALIFSLNLHAKTKIINQIDDSIGTTSELVLGKYTNRNYLLVQNKGVGTIYFKCESDFVGGETGIEIVGGGNYEPFKPCYGDIYLKASSGTIDYVVVEGAGE